MAEHTALTYYKHQQDFLDLMPKKYLLSWGTGCVSGDAIIKYNGTGITTLADLYNRHKNTKIMVQSNIDGVVGLNEVLDIFYSGKKDVYKITLENGYNLKTTNDHKFLLVSGEWKELKDIVIGDFIAVSSDKIGYSKVSSIEYAGVEDTYDIKCLAPYNNFIANGIVVHNCGKTAAAIGWSNKLGTKTLVICPKSLVDNWRREIKKWSNNNSEFIVMSKENFKKNASKLTGINAVIIDEAHHESGYKSQIYKTTLSFTKNIDNVLLMTATPYRSTPFNIFALGTLLGKNWNWFKFNNTFFTTIKRGNRKWPILKQTIDGKPVKEFIADIVKSLGSVVSMDEIVDVPDHIWLREDFTVNAEQKRAINNLLDSTPIARAGHIYQIINGTLKSDGYTKDQYFKCEKFDRALEIISENDKIAVVCRHNLEIKRFADTITDRKVLVLNGETPGGERDKIIQEFNNSDNCVIIINAKVSEGYSLYTPIMLFYSLDWGLVEWTQMIGRPVRLDHLKSVVYINLIYPNTIDEDVYNNVVIKKQDFLAEIYKYEKI